MTYDEAVAEEARIMSGLESVPDYDYRSSVQMMPDPDEGYFVCLAWYKAIETEDRLREFGNFIGFAEAGFPVDGIKVMMRENYTRTQQKLGF